MNIITTFCLVCLQCSAVYILDMKNRTNMSVDKIVYSHMPGELQRGYMPRTVEKGSVFNSKNSALIKSSEQQKKLKVEFF